LFGRQHVTNRKPEEVPGLEAQLLEQFEKEATII
jgi:hypothetical protein